MNESFTELASIDPVLAYRMVVVQLIMDQRGISARELARYMGVSREAVSQSTRLDAVRADGELYRSGTRVASEHHRWLDQMEEAIGQWTAEHGGVYEVTGASALGTQDWQDMVHEYTTRELMDDYEI
jgi:hypothetical protein